MLVVEEVATAAGEQYDDWSADQHFKIWKNKFLNAGMSEDEATDFGPARSGTRYGSELEGFWNCFNGRWRIATIPVWKWFDLSLKLPFSRRPEAIGESNTVDGRSGHR